MTRHLGIDALRLLMALMVVGIHANLLVETSQLGNHLLVNGLLRIAVPIFFIINGYYLEGALKDKKSLWKWSKRIFFLYAFWMCFYVQGYFPLKHPTLQGFLDLPYHWAIGYHHLWYLPGLLGGGWVLYFVKQHAGNKLALVATLVFLIGTTLQYLNYYDDLMLPFWHYRNGLFFAFPMMAFGYVMRGWERPPFSRVRILAACGIGVAGLLLESYMAYRMPHVLGGFDLYFSLLLACPALFLLAQRFNRPLSSDHIAKLSSVLYFMHPMCITFGRTYFSLTFGTPLFFLTCLLCLIFYYPLYLLSKRLRFIL